METTFAVEGGRFRYWLKNDNALGEPAKVWRYHHFASYCSFEQKRATLCACLRKVQSMASDDTELYRSAEQKLAEFSELEYPTTVLRGVCTYLAACTGRYEWIRVRQVISSW